MRISVFSGIDQNPSIDRYARELASAFPATVEASVVWFQQAPGLRGKLFDRYFKYPWISRRHQGDYNIIVSEGYAFLLGALDPDRTAVVCHDVHPLLYQGPTGTYRFRYKLNLRMMARARAIITVSEHTRRDLLKRCPFLAASKIFAVHSGLAPHWFTPPATGRMDAFRRQNHIEGRRVILHVGNDNWYKNFRALIEAFASLESSDLVLVKIGAMRRESFELISRLGIRERFRHVPHTDDTGLRAFYQAAEMMVFPSLHEGFGWPPLEAMACGCPVITTAKASLPEVCGDACLYVEPRAPAAIATAIQRLLHDRDLRTGLVAAGLVQARKFNWTRTAETILELLGAPTVKIHEEAAAR